MYLRNPRGSLARDSQQDGQEEPPPNIREASGGLYRCGADGKSSLAGKGRSDDHSIPGHLADGGMGGQAEDGTLSTVTSFTSRQRIVDGNPGLEAHAGRKADKEGATMLGKQDPQSLSQG